MYLLTGLPLSLITTHIIEFHLKRIPSVKTTSLLSKVKCRYLEILNYPKTYLASVCDTPQYFVKGNEKYVQFRWLENKVKGCI